MLIIPPLCRQNIVTVLRRRLAEALAQRLTLQRVLHACEHLQIYIKIHNVLNAKKKKEKYMVSKSIAAALYELNSPFYPPQEDNYH